jgi:hypothetical protein
MEDFSSVWPWQNRLQSAPTIELCFIHEFAANCYEFLRNYAFDIPTTLENQCFLTRLEADSIQTNRIAPFRSCVKGHTSKSP